MTYSQDRAETALDLIDAAYTLAEKGTCTLPSGFSTPLPIVLNGTPPVTLKNDRFRCWGFSSSFQGCPLVVIRGTQDAPEWIADFECLPLRNDCHYGFSCLFESLYSAIPFAAGTIFIGHSLGGALATLAYHQTPGCELITFGCPRVGTATFAAGLTGTVRVVNNRDLVPEVPLAPFAHGGTEIRVYGPYSIFNAHVAHSTNSYRQGLKGFK